MTTARAILEAIYGRLLTRDSPVKYARMSGGEREALIAQYSDELDADELVLELVVGQARREGVALAVSVFRNAEGFDTDAVDDIVETLFET